MRNSPLFLFNSKNRRSIAEKVRIVNIKAEPSIEEATAKPLKLIRSLQVGITALLPWDYKQSNTSVDTHNSASHWEASRIPAGYLIDEVTQL